MRQVVQVDNHLSSWYPLSLLFFPLKIFEWVPVVTGTSTLDDLGLVFFNLPSLLLLLNDFQASLLWKASSKERRNVKGRLQGPLAQR
ncbi:hypothetical protein QR685DRAFT_521393 [Neurospora intermedia]|uniref:Uncharacterized protein n=1 Tax=Neurospora intermedia TaxID=5142 RepID=A0ABR3DHR3_NEUIN